MPNGIGIVLEQMWDSRDNEITYLIEKLKEELDSRKQKHRKGDKK